MSIDKGKQFIMYRAATIVEQVLTQNTFSRHTDCIIYQQKINIKELNLNGFYSLTRLSVRVKSILIFKFIPFNLVKNFCGEEVHYKCFLEIEKVINFFCTAFLFPFVIYI